MMLFLPLQLCTQIIEKNANPEWNQMLNLQAKVRGLGGETLLNKHSSVQHNSKYDGV